jgi:putative membrane protein
MKDSFWLRIIYIISATISLAVAFLILGPRPEGLDGVLDVSVLPLVNAILNSITTLLLIYAFMLIRQKDINGHKRVMLSAFGFSTLFLISYVIYHWFKAGPKLYIGEWNTFYYAILFSHIVLAIIVIPLALISFYRGWNNQINKHRTIVKVAYPVWLYVSITGVMIYWMLYL